MLINKGECWKGDVKMHVGELELEYPYRQFQMAKEVFELLGNVAEERFAIQLRPAKLLVRLEAKTVESLTTLGKQKQEAFYCLVDMAQHFANPMYDMAWCENECAEIWNGTAEPTQRDWDRLQFLPCQICRVLCLQGVLSIEEINAYHRDELELQGFAKEVQDLVQNIFHRQEQEEAQEEVEERWRERQRQERREE